MRRDSGDTIMMQKAGGCLAIPCALLMLGVVAPVVASAQDSSKGPENASSRILSSSQVLVVAVVKEDRQAALQKSFIEELGLVLDGFKINVEYIDASEFEGWGPARRTAAVSDLAAKSGAASAVWIETPMRGPPVLHLRIVGREGGGMDHVVQEDSSGAAAELALATRAILEELGITAAARDEKEAESDTNAKETTAPFKILETREVEEKIGTEPAAATSDRLALGLRAEILGEVYGGEGTFVQVGGALTFSWMPARLLLLRLVLAGRFGPFDQTDVQIKGGAIEPGFELGIPIPAGPIRLGPNLGIHAAWNSVELNLGGETRDFSWWRGRAELGLEMIWDASERIGLTAAAGLGTYLGKREIFAETGGEEPLFSWPYIDWRFGIGAVFLFHIQ